MSRNISNLLVNRIMERALRRVAPLYLRGRMVDIGCGRKPYEQLVGGAVSEHIGVDRSDPFHPLTKPDLDGDAYSIPVDDGYFDSALCTAVLEHLAEPDEALRECHRVLRPGGHAVYLVPFIWHVHGVPPADYYRFSRYGLEHSFSKAGFRIIELEALSGFWVTFGQLFVYYLNRFNRGPLRLIPLIPAIGLLVQGTAYVLDRIDRAEEWTWMYLVVAERE